MNLETLSKVFEGRIFYIPNYQRGYAWGREQRDDLLEDLENLHKVHQSNSEIVHFTGTLVLRKNAYEGKRNITVAGNNYIFYEIVDGQQRLTTLTLFLWALIDHLQDLPQVDDIPETIHNLSKYVKFTNGALRISLNGNYKCFYESSIINDSTITPTTPTEKNLLDCYNEFKNWCQRKCKYLNDDQKNDFLVSYATMITSKLGFLVHEINSHHEVSIIFETMNARGKPLTQFELVKNLLMYLASRSDQFVNDDALDIFSHRVTGAWHKITQTLQSANLTSNIDEDQYLKFTWAIFPMAQWFKNGKRDSTSDIHKAVKENSKLEVYASNPRMWLEAFLLHLENYAEIYRDLLNPQYSNAFSHINNAQTIIQICTSINRIGRQANLTPLMMTLCRSFPQDTNLYKAFSLIESFSFRLLLFGKYSNTGRSKAYGIAADLSKNGGSLITVMQKIKTELLDTYCTDVTMRKILLDVENNFYGWSGIRYFLYEYERDIAHNQQFHLDWNSFVNEEKNKTIEHILPKGENTLDRVPQWSNDFSHTEWSTYRHSLGNLTICNKDWNSSLGNSHYSKKRGTLDSDPTERVYYVSNYLGMKHIAQQWSEWTPTTIKERQNELADFALRRWPSIV